MRPRASPTTTSCTKRPGYDDGPASRPQVGKIHACLGALHVTDRSEKLRILSAVVYRPITSSNDLTRDEAHVCIDVLDAIAGVTTRPST
jgi:hypothetical protein